MCRCPFCWLGYFRFLGWQSPLRRWELVWSASRAGGGAGMVIPLTPGFLQLTCGAPDQMGVLFLGSPQVQPLIRSCSSIGAEQNALEAFPWTPSSSSSKLPSLIHQPPAPGHSSILFSPSLSPSLPLSLWRSLVPSPRPCPFLTSVRKLKRVRTPARSLERRGLGLQVLICEVFFFFSHTRWRMHTTAHTHALSRRSTCCVSLRNCGVAASFTNDTHPRHEGMSVTPPLTCWRCVCVCVCVCVFLHFCRTKGVVWFPHWCIVGIDGVGEGVGSWDKPLNFDLERQAAGGLKTGVQQEELVHTLHSLRSSWRLFIIIQNACCFVGDGRIFLIFFICFVLISAAGMPFSRSDGLMMVIMKSIPVLIWKTRLRLLEDCCFMKKKTRPSQFQFINWIYLFIVFCSTAFLILILYRPHKATSSICVSGRRPFCFYSTTYICCAESLPFACFHSPIPRPFLRAKSNTWTVRNGQIVHQRSTGIKKGPWLRPSLTAGRELETISQGERIILNVLNTSAIAAILPSFKLWKKRVSKVEDCLRRSLILRQFLGGINSK